MAIQTDTVLKTYFETGDKPTQAEFADLIDSKLNVSDYNPLPSQTGNSGKYLTTNGTTASWGTITSGVTAEVAGSSTVGTVKYNGIDPLSGSFDGGSTNPTISSLRLNFNGNLFATRIYSTPTTGLTAITGLGVGNGIGIYGTSGTGNAIQGVSGGLAGYFNTTGTDNIVNFAKSNVTVASIDYTGKGVFNGGVDINQTQTTVNGSISGNIVCSMPFHGVSCKKILIYANELEGTVSFTFPVAFTNQPAVTTGGSGFYGCYPFSPGAGDGYDQYHIELVGDGSSGLIILEGY